MYSNISTRAGLVALIFALFIAFGAAAPVPTLSHQVELFSGSTSSDAFVAHAVGGRNVIARPDTGVLSTTTGDTVTKARTFSHTPLDANNKLVRRSRISNKIRHAFRKMAHGIAHVAKKAVSAVKSVARKVGTFVNSNKAIIGKFGFKILATAEKIGSKVASYIPVVGKPLSKGLDMAAKATEMASNKIHAKVPGELGKGMDVMDKMDKYSGLFRRREMLKEDAFQ